LALNAAREYISAGMRKAGFTAINGHPFPKKEQRHATQENSQVLIGERLVHNDAPEGVFVLDLDDVHG
jgi:hypothetical protein